MQNLYEKKFIKHKQSLQKNVACRDVSEQVFEKL